MNVTIPTHLLPASVINVFSGPRGPPPISHRVHVGHSPDLTDRAKVVQTTYLIIPATCPAVLQIVCSRELEEGQGERTRLLGKALGSVTSWLSELNFQTKAGGGTSKGEKGKEAGPKLTPSFFLPKLNPDLPSEGCLKLIPVVLTRPFLKT